MTINYLSTVALESWHATVCYSLRLPLFPRSCAIVLRAQGALTLLTHIRGSVSKCAVSTLEDMNVCTVTLSGCEVPGPLAPVAFF